MKRNCKRVAGMVSAMILAMLYVFSAGLPVLAEERDGDATALEATSYKVGDIIKFGHYEQDGNTTNGKEEIEWEVLKVESDRVLAVSKYGLDCKKYNDTKADVTWETCSLRKWLNNDFMNIAFTLEEQSRIPTVIVENEDNPLSKSRGGNSTQDKLFCLSLNEIKNLIGYNWYNDAEYDMSGYSQKMIVEPTQYAINNGALVYTITSDDYYKNVPMLRDALKDYGYTSDVIGCRGCRWCLRSPGSKNYGSMDSASVCCVSALGLAGPRWYYDVSDKYSVVRPALYINIPKVYPKSISLDKTSSIICYGELMTLALELTPSDVTETAIIWTSSNPAVATVNNGTVKATGKQAGTTTITAKTVNALTATCEVTVYADNNPSNTFADIKYGTWQYNSAMSVYDKGYMTGKGMLGDRIIFSPDTNINRSQFVVALYSMDGKPSVSYKQKFSDVSSKDWYASAVTWASDNGIVAGNPDGSFGVNGKATREQLALMFYKYAMYMNYDVSVSPSTTLDGFTDAAKVDSWAVTAIKWAVERGIISGKGNEKDGYRIDPTKGATRIECAAMMNKFDSVYSDVQLVLEAEEEPLALPMEEVEEAPVADENIEDVVDEDNIEDEDVAPADEDIIDDEDSGVNIEDADEDTNPEDIIDED